MTKPFKRSVLKAGRELRERLEGMEDRYNNTISPVKQGLNRNIYDANKNDYIKREKSNGSENVGRNVREKQTRECESERMKIEEIVERESKDCVEA